MKLASSESFDEHDILLRVYHSIYTYTRFSEGASFKQGEKRCASWNILIPNYYQFFVIFQTTQSDAGVRGIVVSLTIESKSSIQRKYKLSNVKTET